MSVRHLTAVFAEFPGKGLELTVMLALADFANERGVAYPSIATLAKKARCSERQAQRILQALVQAGHLVVVRNTNGGSVGATRCYQIVAQAGKTVEQATVEIGANVTGDMVSPVTQLCQGGGDTAMSPDPSLNRHKKERLRARTRANLQPLPDAWQPNAGHAALAAKLQVDLQAEVEAFRDHHRAKASRFADWDAALRTWLRNASKWRGPATTKPVTTQLTKTQPTTRWQAQENQKDWLNELLGRNRKSFDLECDARTVDSPPF